jgi:hypothetical protein
VSGSCSGGSTAFITFAASTTSRTAYPTGYSLVLSASLGTTAVTLPTVTVDLVSW